MEGLLATSPSWAITVVRVVLGVVFFAHGAQKVLGWFGGYGLRGTTGYLQSNGLPLPVAYLVCFFEFLGGIGLVLGLLTRLAALAVAVVMVGAIVKVHWPHGFFLNWNPRPARATATKPTWPFSRWPWPVCSREVGRWPSTHSWLASPNFRSSRGSRRESGARAVATPSWPSANSGHLTRLPAWSPSAPTAPVYPGAMHRPPDPVGARLIALGAPRSPRRGREITQDGGPARA